MNGQNLLLVAALLLIGYCTGCGSVRAGDAEEGALSKRGHRSVAGAAATASVVRPSVVRPSVTLNTFTVEAAGSALSFIDDTFLTGLSGSVSRAGKPSAKADPASSIEGSKAEPERPVADLLPIRLATKTVYGFLDFTTTVSDTVMIFKPSKAPGEKRKNSVTASVALSKAKIADQTSKNVERIRSTETVTVATSTVAIDAIKMSSEEERNMQEQPQEIETATARKVNHDETFHIEGSLINFGDSSTHDAQTERLKPTAAARGSGSISMFPIRSHVVVSSRVDVRIGGVSKLVGPAKLRPSSSSALPLPKPVSVRIGMNFEDKPAPQPQPVTTPKPKPSRPEPSKAEAQTLDVVSKTASTSIRNGMTTVYETSILRTTIKGQVGHAVISTSRVFQESVPSIVPTLARGTVEVVTEMPAVSNLGSKSAVPTSQRIVSSPAPRDPPQPEAKPTTERSKTSGVSEAQIHKEKNVPLPSLESLFESVASSEHKDGHILQQADSEKLPEAERLVAKTTTPATQSAVRGEVIVADDEDDEPTAVVLKPSRFTAGAIKGNRPAASIQRPSVVIAPQSLTSNNPIERRAGLASPPRVRINDNGDSGITQRPLRRENRWRYTPQPKPIVPIVRTEQRPAFGGSNVEERRPFISNEQEALAASREDESPEIEPSEVKTLRVHTVTPEGYSNIYYEVATIKSPYVMRLGSIRNTRYVTMTKTHTRRVVHTPPPAEIPEEEPEILLDSSLPLAENILATTTPYENILKDSSDTATLPAIIVAATESESLTLETVTESFSTTELMMKTSILPYLKAGETSFMTLTQSYFITRMVTAIKTVPPADLYQFIPSRTLTDLSTILQEAGSEHNEHLLPGELEFSENDEYSDDEGPHEKRVPPPPGFLESDLSLIGQDFDVSSMDKPSIELEPSLVSGLESTDSAGKRVTPPLPYPPQSKPSVDIEPSIVSPVSGVSADQALPALTPEQLQQLALYRFMNPYAAAGLPFGYPGLPGGLPGFGGIGDRPQVITTSRPVVRTTDVIKTQVVPIWDGVKTIYSTIARTLGTTVVTETEYGTSTLSLPSVNPFGQQFTVVSSPVVTDIMTTSTELRIYRIIFRAQTTYTTVTSTTVFPTQVTTYVSSTIPIQPTAFPGFGFGFPGFAG